MKINILRSLFLGLLFLPLAITAQEWTPEDIIYRESPGSTTFSDDNTKVVWTKRRAVKDKDRFVSDIYLTYLDRMDDGVPVTVQLTRSDDSDYNPMFSADGRYIYFLSGREKGNKLWKLDLYGGEAEEVFSWENGISSLQWRGDDTLLFLSNEGETYHERELKKSKDDTQVIEDTVYWKRTQVYAVDLSDKEPVAITSFDRPVRSLTISNDGKWMITSLQMSPHYPADAQPKTQYYLHDLEAGTQSRILEGLQEPGRFEFDLEDNGFYFTAELSSDPEWNGAGISELYYFDLTSGDYNKIDLNWSLGAASGPSAVEGGVLIHLANRAYYKVAYYQKNGDGWQMSLVDMGDREDHVRIQEVSDDGTHALFTYSTASSIPEFLAAGVVIESGELSLDSIREFVQLNDKLKKKELAKSEVYEWVGAYGDTVNGILYYPIGYEEGKSYPLILSIHGGPSGVDVDQFNERWSTYPNILTEKGAFVLRPNYHGSSNHGQAFVESIKGHYYDLEMVDIMNGIRSLASEGKVDTMQMGVMGWSNGAILATMLTVRYPDHFKFATPGAGDVNWTSDFGTCRFGVSFDQSYFGGAPWDDTGDLTYNPTYIEKSPLFELEKVKTPTLIFHGSNDRAVPRDQGWEYYRALQQAGNTAVRFLWFPNQPHGLQKISHQLRKMNEEIKWIDTYLFEKTDKDNPAIDEDSPLAMLMKRTELSKIADGAFGLTVNGRLVPEVAAIEDDSISIGVLEVTNAQFAAFAEGFTYPAGEGNKPVVGIGRTLAIQYLNALSAHTGDSYRLPTEEEANALHKKAKKAAGSENTLDHWAGFKPTSREVELIHDKLDELDGNLFTVVASFDPVDVGEASVYDLGGNAAELSETGQYGLSAYQASNTTSSPAEEHTGFRVVKE